MRRYAVPIALASSMIKWRRASNREPAPEKVNAISRPSSPKTAPSRAPLPPGAAYWTIGRVVRFGN